MASKTRFTNQMDLAKYLGCSRDALKKWLKMEKFAKGRPKRTANSTYDGPAYKKWMNLHGLRGRGSSGDRTVVTIDDLSPLDRQKHRQGELKIAQMEEALEQQKRSAVDPVHAYEVMVKSISSFVTDMEKLMGVELPPMSEGLTSKQQSALNLKRFREVLKDWKTRSQSEFFELRKKSVHRRNN
ncbi:hypothetical protein MLD52_09230 [Puniceicoccaceae bacterium K14]|nr:hypothetical protein [Puniceicoccaceae bacterium K14]